MKRSRLKTMLFGLAALLIISGLVVLPVARGLQQEAKDRALIAAIKKDDVPGVARLLNEGANANARDLTDLPIDTRPFWRICSDLLRGRHQINQKWAPTALEEVVSVRREDDFFLGVNGSSIVKALLEHGADPNLHDPDNYSPLYCSLLTRDRASADASSVLLIRYGATLVYTEDQEHIPLLVAAAARGVNASILKAMLDRGADINAREPNTGATALMEAVAYGTISDVRFLLAHHADAAVKDADAECVKSFEKKVQIASCRFGSTRVQNNQCVEIRIKQSAIGWLLRHCGVGLRCIIDETQTNHSPEARQTPGSPVTKDAECMPLRKMQMPARQNERTIRQQPQREPPQFG